MRTIAAHIYTAVRSVLKDKKVRGALQVLLSAALLAWLAQRVGLRSILNTLAGIDWFWYSIAFALSILNIFLRSYRWHALLSALDDRPPFLQLVYYYFLGFFFNNFIPSGFGGDVVKVIGLRQEHGRGAEALSSVIMDRLVGLIGSTLIASIVLAWNALRARSGQGMGLQLPAALLISIALISVGIPVAFLFARWTNPLGWAGSRLPFLRPLTTHGSVQRLVNTIRRYPWLALLKALLTSVPFTLSLILIQYLIALALSIDVPFHLFPLFVPIISIINLLPLSFNGLGMREGVYQFLFVPAGVSGAGAIAMSLSFYFLRVAIGIIGGLLYAIRSAGGFAGATRTEKVDL